MHKRIAFQDHILLFHQRGDNIMPHLDLGPLLLRTFFLPDGLHIPNGLHGTVSLSVCYAALLWKRRGPRRHWIRLALKMLVYHLFTYMIALTC